MNDEVKDSQQEPQDDSALQTPQPDQPHPPVSDRPNDAAEDSQELDSEQAGASDDAAKDSPPIDVDVNVGNSGSSEGES